MSFKKVGNLLPKKIVDRVALKTLSSQHQLSRLRGLRKQTILGKIFLVVTIVFYLSGYQPALRIPPIKQAVAKAEFSQQQKIEAGSFAKPFILPHPGYLTTRYSIWHPGVDIATGLGMPVRPITDGTITLITFSFWGLGNHVIVDHGQGLKSTYGHMGRVYVKNGDSVNTSSILGEVGLTGKTSGPHTHLEVTKDDKTIDPLTLLPALSDYPDESLAKVTEVLSTEEKQAQQQKVDIKKELKFNL